MTTPVGPAAREDVVVRATGEPSPRDMLHRSLYDAECALHAARQSGIDEWIEAAADRLHEIIVGSVALEHESLGACPPQTMPRPRRSQPRLDLGTASLSGRNPSPALEPAT